MSESENPKIKVILVEDQELTRVGIKVALERTAEVEVVGEAADGIQAVELVGRLEHDLVLMDIGLPIMNGIDASRKIREMKPDSRCLILTSHTETNYIFAAMGAGARGYSQKSVTTARLLNAIKVVYDGDVWLDPEIAVILFSKLGDNANDAKVCQAEQANNAAGFTVKQSGYNLTERELEILGLVVSGLRNVEIAEKLFISVDTVKSHMSHIIDKLAVTDRTQAALKALRLGMVSL